MTGGCVGTRLGRLQPGKGAGGAGEGERPAVPGAVAGVQHLQYAWGNFGVEGHGRTGRPGVQGRGPCGGERTKGVGFRFGPQTGDGEAEREAVQNVRRDLFDVLGAADGEPARAGPPPVAESGVFHGGDIGPEELDGGARAGNAQPGEVGHDDERGAGARLGQRPGLDGELDAFRAAADPRAQPQVLVDGGRVERRPLHRGACRIPAGHPDQSGEHIGDGGEMLRRQIEEQDSGQPRFEGGADEHGEQSAGQFAGFPCERGLRWAGGHRRLSRTGR